MQITPGCQLPGKAGAGKQKTSGKTESKQQSDLSAQGALEGEESR